MRKGISVFIYLSFFTFQGTLQAQTVIDAKGTKRIVDATNDAWVNDNSNSMVKLGTQSNATTARAAGADVVIKDNGRVGIGTTTPQAILHVKNGDFRLENENDNWNAYKGVTYSNTQYPQLFLFQARGTKASPTYPQAGSTLGVFRSANAIDSAGGAGFRVRSTENQSATAHGTSMIIFTAANGQDGNSDRFIVDQNGNTGIGTMNPPSKLSVEDNGTGTYLNVASLLAPSNTTAGYNTALKLGVSATNKNSGEIRFNYAGDQSNNNRLDFSFNSLPAPLASITAGGNVGINTTTPQKTLHVFGSAQITGELNVGGNATTAGSAGTSGQVLTSNGAGAAPAWKSSSTVPGTIAAAVYVQGTTAATTTTFGTSATAIDVPGVTYTHTVPAGASQTLLFTITGYAVRSVTADNEATQGVFVLLQDGVKKSSAYTASGDFGSLSNVPTQSTILKSITLTSGTYVFKVQYKAWFGNQTVNFVPSGYLGYSSDAEAMLTKMQILVYNN